MLVWQPVSCDRKAKPIPGLTGIPIESPTPPPTATPTPTPFLEPPIVIRPQVDTVDPDARLLLTIIVEDEAGWLQSATVTFTWSDESVPLVVLAT
jgi:hypothetical protein